MEAKDTVMNKKDCFVVEGEYISDFGLQQRLQAQAEISFKAGRTSGILDMEKQVADAYKGGIREVVEWIDKNLDDYKGWDFEHSDFAKLWQAQKRKWGI